MTARDAIVVGSGPNGLAAAITLARAGRSVLVRESASVIGGGTRTAELTLPGFAHDVCSAVHPLGLGSPFFRAVPLHEHGLGWVEPEVQLAHPLDDGSAAVLVRSIDESAASLDVDGAAWRALVGPFAERWDALAPEILGPLLHRPHHPWLLARFGMRALRSAGGLARATFTTARTRGMFAGLCAHAMVPLDHAGTAAFGLVLGALAHAIGWPVARGGSAAIAASMAAYLRSLGGEIVTDAPVTSLRELDARATILDLTPRQILRIAGDRLPARYARALDRFRYGPGVFKVDWALSEPVPWRAEACRRAGTVHLGGTLEEIEASEAAPWRGEHAERPFVLVAQQSLCDDTRAPAGRHTLWAYCHVPLGSTEDMTARIEAQIERFAPGFRDCVLARATRDTRALEAYDANLVGGDIGAGANTLRQVFARPTLGLTPYTTPVRGLYLCSASTPPGGGVHGMCGYHAARAALRDLGA